MPPRKPDPELKNKEVRPRRRGHGSIRWYESRQRYRASLVVSPPGAKTVLRTRWAATAEEAEELLEEMRADKAAGMRAARDTSFGAWCERWVDEEEDIKPTTKTERRSRIDHYIKPAIGGIKLADLSVDDVRYLQAFVKNKGLSPTTALHAHRVGSAAMSAAVSQGKANVNPFKMVKAPRKADSNGQAMSAEQIGAFEKAIEGLDDEVRWQMAIYLGVRQGEALGLTWDRVVGLDTDVPVIDIYWALNRIQIRCGCGARKPHTRALTNCPEPITDLAGAHEHRKLGPSFYLMSPKTAKSRRAVPVPPWMVEPLRRRREIYERERMSPKYTDHGLVFCNSTGRYVSHKTDNDHWLALLEKAGIPRMRLHDARHTSATALMRAGADQTAIMEILGHSTYLMTRGYQHADVSHLSTALKSLRPT